MRISIVRIGAHCISGAFIGLAALCYTALIGSGDPTQGTTYTLIAVTALVLGGTSLAGGRGGVIGSLLGALNLFLIGYVLATFNFGMVQGFVTDLAYGVILVLSLLLTVALPHVQRHARRLSPFLVFVVLSLLFAGVMLHAKHDYAKYQQAESVGLGAPQAKAQTQAQTQAPRAATLAADSFIFEAPSAGAAFSLTALQRTTALAALLLLALVLFLRVTVSQTRARTMTPVLYGGFAVVIVLGVWLLSHA